MATATYQTALESFSRQPILLVRLTVAGTITGSQVFRFSNKEAETIHFQIGEDVRPYLLSFRGRPTRIRPDQSVTERSRLSLSFADDPNPPDFDSTKFDVFTGGSFWKRLFLSQPDFIGSKVEVLRGFIEPGFLEVDFELIFVGRLEDYQFQNDGSVTLVAKDALVLTKKETPSQINDSNEIAGAIGAADISFTVDDGTEISAPSSFGSKDLMPLVLRIDPDTGSEEDVIVGDISGNTVTVAENFLQRSEEFENAIWNQSDPGVSVLVDQTVSPFGGTSSADKINFASVAEVFTQTPPVFGSLANKTFVFSIWLKAEVSGTFTLDIQRAPDADFSQVVSLTTSWQRFELVANFGGGAGTTIIVRLRRDTTDLDHVFAFGAQLEERSARGFYVATTDLASSGTNAGRGAFGTTATTHAIDDKFIEVLIYRHQLSEFGIHPIVITHDLVSRTGITDADVDLDIFNAEFEADTTIVFRRGNASGFVDSTIIEPESINSLISQVRRQSGIDVWISEIGDVRAKSPLTILPGDSITIISDENNVVTDSFSYLGNTDSRVTRMLVYFNLIAEKSGNTPADFLNVRVNVDLAVETLSGPKSRVIFSKWIFQAAEADRIANNTVSRFKRGNRTGRISFELRDDLDILVGDIIALNSDGILTIQSTTTAQRGNTFWQVTQKQDDRERGQIKLEMALISDKHICFIAPVSPPFPADFDDASLAQRVFGFIGTSGTNKLGVDAEDGCVIS